MKNIRHRMAITSYFAALIIILTTACRVLAQPADDGIDAPEENLESRVGATDFEGAHDFEILDELEEYRRKPIDLYTATPDALARLPEISISDAETIIAFVERSAPSNIIQLDSIPDLTAGQLLSLRSFTTLRHRNSTQHHNDFAMELRTRLVTDLQPRRGYRDQLQRVIPRRDIVSGDSLGLDTISLGSSYLGGRPAIFTRAMASWNGVAAGVTFEKDAGEPLTHSDTLDYTYRRFEYVDPAAAVHNVRSRIGSFVSTFASIQLAPAQIYLGDYSAGFGQDLLFGGAFGGIKGRDVTGAPYKASRGLAAYRSSGETSFLRGAGITFNQGVWLPKGVTASIFGSYRLLDATINDATVNDGSGTISDTATTGSADAMVETVSSIRNDGLRRTHGELRSSGNLAERLLGANLRWTSRSEALGITAYTSHYSARLAGDLPGDFTGNNVAMASADGRYTAWWGTLFGEIARATNGAIAAMGGGTAHVGHAEITVAGRMFPADFYTPHGSGFGEAPFQQHNERGVYVAADIPIAPEWKLACYLDLYDSPDRSYTVSFPRNGADGYLGLDYTPLRDLEIHMLFRNERKRDQITVTDTLGRDRRRIADRIITSGRIEAAWRSPGSTVRLRARLERRFVDYDSGLPARDGFLSFIDVRLIPFRPLTLGMRMALFATDDYDAAIYEFEPDLPGILTNLPLSGEGRRFYLYLRWHPSRNFSLAVKYAETVFADRMMISPGDTQQIDGPRSNTLALQADIAL